MVKKYFNVSYQGVKDWIGNLLFVGILWFVLNKYFEQIINPKFIKSLNLGSSFELLGIVLIGYLIIFLIYGIAQSLVTLAYWFFDCYGGCGEIYPSLKELDIKIPLIKKYYWKIKEHKNFASRYPGELKSYFDRKKFDEWAAKIIEKELSKISGGK